MILEYVAGLFDGEGSISILRHKSKQTNRGFFLAPRVSLSNTDRRLEDLLEKLGFKIRWLKNGDNSKPIAKYEMEGMNSILTFMERLKPYLILKQEQANLIIEFCISRLNRRAYRYTERELEIVDRLSRLNKRGL